MPNHSQFETGNTPKSLEKRNPKLVHVRALKVPSFFQQIYFLEHIQVEKDFSTHFLCMHKAKVKTL